MGVARSTTHYPYHLRRALKPLSIIKFIINRTNILSDIQYLNYKSIFFFFDKISDLAGKYFLPIGKLLPVLSSSLLVIDNHIYKYSTNSFKHINVVNILFKFYPFPI